MGQSSVPYPSVGFPRMVRDSMSEGSIPSQILSYSSSGELTADVVGFPLGTVTESGKLSDFVVSVVSQGQDNTDALKLAANLMLNGSSVLSGEISIEGVSGETPSAATGTTPTFTSTDVSRGDRLSLDLKVTRTTPESEIKSVSVAVKITPVYS